MKTKVKKYQIETSMDIDVIREKIDKLFDESNHIFKKRGFIGTLKNDNFQGTTDYSVHIDLKGNINQNKDSTFINLTITDNSPNNLAHAKTLLIIFCCIILIILAVNKSTNMFLYLLPLLIFGLTWIGLYFKQKASNFFKPKLKDSANIIANAVQGKIMTIK